MTDHIIDLKNAKIGDRVIFNLYEYDQEFKFYSGQVTKMATGEIEITIRGYGLLTNGVEVRA